MGKKFCMLFVLAFLAAGGVFAKGSFIVDTAPLLKGVIASDSDSKTSFFGLGAEYQHVLGKQLSLGARMDLIAGKVMNVDAFYFGFSLHGRYYLSAILEKAFIDAGLGVNTARVNDEKVFLGLSLELKAGYTVPLGKSLRLEPALSYIVAKSGGFPTPLGWQLGLGLGFAF
jgi:hypothetical protein